MADPRFFNRRGPFTLAQLAEIAGAEILRGDPGAVFEDIAPLDRAGKGHVSFLDNIRYRDAFSVSQAGLCIVADKMVAHAPPAMALLVSDRPYRSYALAAQAFYPDEYPDGRIDPRAAIDPSAVIGAGCVIESGAVIGSGAEIGEGSWIEANTVIGPRVKIGRRCRIGANSTVSHAMIGDGTRLYPGVRVGQDGFGFAIDPSGFVKVPQVGRVIIGDHVEIGANTCIDRGAGPDTEIGDGTWIDNMVQIGHNVKIGKRCVIVAQSGIAGSTVLEDYVVLAAQSGIAGHLHVARGAKIGAQAGVMRNVDPGQELLGSPALPIRQYMRQIATLNRLTRSKEG